jgi:diguanylate cyclase (GGDEF)-like protein
MAGAWGLWQLRQVSDASQALASGEALGVNLADDMRVTLLLQVQALKDTWLRGSDPEQFARYSADFDARADDMRGLRARMEQVRPVLTHDENVMLTTFDAEWARYIETWPRAKDAFGGPGGTHVADADAAIKGMDRQAVSALGQLTASLTARRDTRAAAISEQVTIALLWGRVILGLSLVLAISQAVVFVNVILRAARPIGAAARHIARTDLPTFVATAQALARGDLSLLASVTTPPVPESRFTDLRHMASDFNEILDGLHATQRAFTQMGADLARKAFYDELTGLPNRALLVNHLGEAPRAAVLWLGLDRFKLVNESMGRDAGNQLLILAAQRLHGCLSDDATLARVGGDEFVVVLHNADLDCAVLVAQTILTRLHAPFLVADREVFVGASIGIALAELGLAQGAPEALLRAADVALGQAKRDGGDRYAIVERGAARGAVERLALEADLRRAIERGELRLQYQPIFDLPRNELVGVEALVRWQHPERGLVPPSDFIPLAEDSGLIVAIGEWVLDTACRQARLWRERRPETPLIVSVNLSARQLAQPDLVERVAFILQEAGLEPSLLKLEITETAAMANVETAIATLHALREHGVRLAVDDFGTGYSSLAYLRRFPVDTLKVDRAFVQGLEHDSSARSLVGAVIALGRALGMDVTAEGIETEGQLSQLRDLRCSHGQGYLLSRPTSVEAIDALLGGLGIPPIAAPALKRVA